MVARSLCCSLLVLALSACGESKSYVLVHGAWMGAWSWSAVAEELRADGHDVTVVELPAHGADPATPADATLEAYVGRVLTAVDAADRPVVLVAHSMGGIVISQAAERRPAGITELVYVAAYLPRDGENLFGLSLMDEASGVGAALTDDGSDGTLDIRTDALVDLFCQDCEAAQAQTLRANYRTEPARPLTEPVSLGAAFASVPRRFVRTTLDRVISPAMQDRMIERDGAVEVVDLVSSHSPALSRPAELSSILRGR